VRLQAAQMFAQGMTPAQVAAVLRVTPKSARVWRRAWLAGGEQALASKGPGGATCRLDDNQLERLQAELERGPAAYGYTDDQRWTLARIADLIMHVFRVSYTPQAVWYLMRRLGWSPQVPAHRAAERDEASVRSWVKTRWPALKG
jgi:transposase